MSRILHRLGYSTAAHPWRTISAWLVVVVAAFALAGSFGGTTHDDYDIPDARAQAGIEQLRAHVPDGGGAHNNTDSDGCSPSFAGDASANGDRGRGPRGGRGDGRAAV